MFMESLNNLASILGVNVFLILGVVVWTLAWKGVALWRAARLNHRNWFIALIIINTLGILEIIYLFFVARRYKVLVEVIEEK